MTDETKGDGMTLDAPPLAGDWRYNNGYLCCGTFRVMVADWEAGVCAANNLRNDVGKWIARTLNAAYEASEQAERDSRYEDDIAAHLAAQSAMRVDEAISRAPLKLRGLAKVIREHGTCAAAALEHVADELQAAIGGKE